MGNNSCGQASSGVVDIVQGADKTFYVDLYYPDTLQPFNLTGVDQITAYLPATAGTPIELKLTDNEIAVNGAAGAGQIGITVDDAQSALALVNPVSGQYQDLQIDVTIDDKTTIVILTACLNILAQPKASNS